jgi:hypothetical protein
LIGFLGKDIEDDDGIFIFLPSWRLALKRPEERRGKVYATQE